MAIKMDGHTITALQLKASDGSEVTKQLTEEGTIPTPTESLSITANGTYDVTDKASAVVNVPAPEINLQNKTATANGEVTADEGYDGLGVVTVAVSGDVPTLVTKEITTNGTYPASADNADGYSSVTVAVPVPELNLQDKTITTNGTYTADVGYDGFGEVVVNVESGGGSSDIVTPWFTIKTAEIIVGANTASKAQTIIGYFEGLYGEGNIVAIYLKSSSASYVDNQLVSLNTHLTSNTSIAQPIVWDAYRMKNNAPATFQPTSGYDCSIPEGSTYIVQYYTNKI